jgi:unsaturated chondroitin disaccharide hydrolase
MRIDDHLRPADLRPKLARLWELSAGKLHAIQKVSDPNRASLVYTVDGAYTARGWTEWTRGFELGSGLLQFDATDEPEFLPADRRPMLSTMAHHLSHIGVHDHGFNNISTYGNLWRLMNLGRIPEHPGERSAYELALKVSGAVQAARWQRTAAGGGYIYSFNGPHSLFVDTLRSCRSLAVAHQLGHVLMAEHDERVSLLARLVGHAQSTARWNVYYGEGRDHYDLPGRTAHESIFNVNDGNYRCPSTQQGYSPFSTWTRGLSWAILGFSELLEWLTQVGFVAGTADPNGTGRGIAAQVEPYGTPTEILAELTRAATITCDFYLRNTASDGIPYWDTGAPGLVHLDGWRQRPADPYNPYEPVDSSAAAIAGQGLLRLGRFLGAAPGEPGERYWQAGLTVAGTLFAEPYLSVDPGHQGLLLHSVYHRPNGWDRIPAGAQVPNGESSMWGDYHARELALYLMRCDEQSPYYTFFGPEPSA